MKKIITLFAIASCLFSLQSKAQCSITSMTATPGACNPGTNLYNVTGTITVTNPPTTGTLVIGSTCGGNVNLSPPFASTITYTLTGLTSDGASCNVGAGFTASPLCSSTASYTAPVSCQVGIREENIFSNVSISPNPSKGLFNLSFDLSHEETVAIEVYDVLGSKVYKEELSKFSGSYKKQIDLASIKSGIYFLKISGKKGSTTQKIICN